MTSSTKLVRSRDGRTVHLARCARVVNVFDWRWAENLTDDEIYRTGLMTGLRFCKSCDPMHDADKDLWYNMSGLLISRSAAADIMLDADRRLLKVTSLLYSDVKLAVYTAFMCVDHNPETFGTYTETPACWCTEIVGGPVGLDGTKQYSTSRNEALVFHQEVVEQALASGCIEA